MATRTAIAPLALIVSFALTLALSVQALQTLSTPDAVLVSRFQGAAYEDIFGFGFWPTWSVLAFTQGVALAFGWLSLRGHWLRKFVPILLGAFVLASIIGYEEFAREHGMWSSYTGR